MTANTAGPRPAQIVFVSLISYPPLVFDCGSLIHAPSRTLSSSLYLLLILILVLSQSASVRAHIGIVHGRSLMPPTLQIVPLGTFQGPGILKLATSTRILSRLSSVPGSNRFIMHLLFTLVHLLSFCFACFAVSRLSARCFVGCRLLPVSSLLSLHLRSSLIRRQP